MIQIHHFLWHYYQLITLVPAMAIFIHRMVYRKNYNDFQIREKYDNMFEALNLFDVQPNTHKKNTLKLAPNATKEQEQEYQQQLKRPYIEGDMMDKVFRVYLGFAIVYYLADVIIKFYEMIFPSDYLDICKNGFAIHHIFTLFSFKSIFVIDHYPWFLAGPTAYHPMMVVFPNFPLNNAIYLGCIGAWMYNLRMQPVYWNTRIGKSLFYISCSLMIPIIMLWLGECMTEFKWED